MRRTLNKSKFSNAKGHVERRSFAVFFTIVLISIVAAALSPLSQSSSVNRAVDPAGPENNRAVRQWPTGLLPAAAEQLALDQQDLWAPENGDNHGRVLAKNRKHGFSAAFNRDGLSLTSAKGETIQMHLAGLGRSDNLTPVGNIRPAIEGTRVNYHHEQLSHWFINSPFGLEQGITLSERPSGEGQVQIALELSGSLTPRLQESNLVFVDATGAIRFRYGQLGAVDAAGNTLPAEMALVDSRVILSLNDTAAVYPVIIDPLFAAESRLTASDGAAQDYFGCSVSVDGDTAVVGADGDDNASGSAYVFVRSGGAWVQQAKLRASDAAPRDHFGYSVSLDGDTAVIGAYGYDYSGSTTGSSFIGAAYVFVRSGGTWNQQAKLTASDAAAGGHFGWSVSVSGNTAVIGAFGDDDAGAYSGAAYVFARNGSAWSQQAKLRPSDSTAGDWFGRSVSVDNDTIVVGAPQPDILNGYQRSAPGAAYVFVRSGSAWSQQARLTASDGAVNDNLGWSVALSGDTAVAGAWLDDDAGSASGSAYVFVRNGSSWLQQAKLTAADAAGGMDLGLSASIDGNVALVGTAPGRPAYAFTRTGNAWSQNARLYVPNMWFGGPVAVSGDIAFVGSWLENASAEQAGSAYVFAPAADLAVAQHADADPIALGGTVTYTITISNNDAAVDATGVTIVDTLPQSTTFVSASPPPGGSCSPGPGGDTVTCSLGTVPKGTAEQATICLRADGAGDIINTVSVSADQSDPDTANNTAGAATHVNAPPSITAIPDQAMNEDSTITIPFIVGDAETTPGELSISGSSSDITLVSNSGLTFGGSGSNRTLTISPASNLYGAAVITVTVSDGMTGTATSFMLTVNSVNDPPSIDPIGDQAMDITQTSVTVPVKAGDIDTDPDTLLVSAASGSPGLVPDANLTLQKGAVDPADPSKIDWTLTVTPAAGQWGDTAITVTFSDGTATASASFSLAVLNSPVCGPLACPDGIEVTPAPGVAVTFSSVTAAGQTTATTSPVDPMTGSCPGTGNNNFLLDILSQCYDIHTSAAYSGDVTICLTYDQASVPPPPFDEASLTFMHWETNPAPPPLETWANRTISVDTVNNIICGTVSSFSWFAIAVDNAPPTFTLNRLKDTLWPPNHKMVRVATVTNVADNSDPSPTVDIRVSTTDVPAGKDKHEKDKHSHKGEKDEKDGKDGRKHKDREDDDAEHDGDRHARDWKVRKRGDTWDVWVRAERPGDSTDRICTITATVTDRAGNQATDSHTVLVPHDKNKKETHGKKQRNNRRR